MRSICYSFSTLLICTKGYVLNACSTLSLLEIELKGPHTSSKCIPVYLNAYSILSLLEAKAQLDATECIQYTVCI